MTDPCVLDPSVVLGPSYNLYQFSDRLFKVVHFRTPWRRLRPKIEPGTLRKEKTEKAEKKLDAAISRAKRVVLEKALCNDWDWFGTFTLDRTKYDRYDLDKFYKDFTQWIRDQRKKHNVRIAYILIPEMHGDGAWHMHGLLRGVPDIVTFAELRSTGMLVPDILVRGDFSMWRGFHEKFGFCSLGRIKNAEASAFYITKYVGKCMNHSGISVGRHLYYCSHRLERAHLRGKVYGESDYLDKFLVNHYEFCDTGMARAAKGFDWDVAMDMCESCHVEWHGKLFEISGNSGCFSSLFHIDFSFLG